MLIGGQEASPGPDSPSLPGGLVPGIFHKHVCPFISSHTGGRHQQGLTPSSPRCSLPHPALGTWLVGHGQPLFAVEMECAYSMMLIVSSSSTLGNLELRTNYREKKN